MLMQHDTTAAMIIKVDDFVLPAFTMIVFFFGFCFYIYID